MAEVSLEMLQGLVQRVIEEQVALRQEFRQEIGRLNGRISMMDRRLGSVLSMVKAGVDTAADLQNQIDVLAERVEQLEEARR